MKLISLLFLFSVSTSFSQTKIDSVKIYSSSLDFYLGNDPYEYTLPRFKREENPLIISDSLDIIEVGLKDTIVVISQKKSYVYFIVEMYSNGAMKTFYFDDNKYLYFENRKYKKMKKLYAFFIGVIEKEYNRIELNSEDIISK